VKRVLHKPWSYSGNERDAAETDNVHKGYPESRDFEKMLSVDHSLSFQISYVYLSSASSDVTTGSCPYTNRHLGPERSALLGFSFAEIAQAKNRRLLRRAKIRPDITNRGTA
jgi:hypothetical protein